MFVSLRLALVFISVLLVDQITKLIFTPLEISHLKFLTGFSTRDFFVGPTHIHSVKNYGLAFSLDFGPVLNLILIFAAAFFFVYFFLQHKGEFSVTHQMAFGLIFAGATSNILDRLYFGYVRDFLDLGLNFTFNLADVFVVVGLGIILLNNQNNS